MPVIFSISRVPVTAGLLCQVLKDVGVNCAAIVVYGMKDVQYLHGLSNVPLSPDPRVVRRYDIGICTQTDDIPFLCLMEEMQETHNGKVHTMCGNLGGGGGSVRDNFDCHDPRIHHSHVTVYLCFLHQIKMRDRARKTLTLDYDSYLKYTMLPEQALLLHASCLGNVTVSI